MCSAQNSLCGVARAECIAGTPNKLGTCVCEQAALVNTGLATQGVTKVPAGAFGGGGFYWAEYHYDFVASSAYTTIVTRREDVGVRVILERLGGSVTAMRVTDDTIYLESEREGFAAITLDGEALPNPTAEEAFPPGASRVTADENGVYVDGARFDEPVDAFSEVTDGIYLARSGFLSFKPFDGSPPRLVPARIPPELYVDGVWASGSILYVSGLHQLINDRPYELNVADLSVVGK